MFSKIELSFLEKDIRFTVLIDTKDKNVKLRYVQYNLNFNGKQDFKEILYIMKKGKVIPYRNFHKGTDHAFPHAYDIYVQKCKQLISKLDLELIRSICVVADDRSIVFNNIDDFNLYCTA